MTETYPTEYWDIDGTSLHRKGWSVSTMGGSRYDLPEWRGEDELIAGSPGELWLPKIPASRVVTLSMWVTGGDPATGVKGSHSLSTQWNYNWETLRNLVYKPLGAQVTLTRRWNQLVSGVETLITASALTQVVGNMSPTMTGRARADFVLDLKLADPFFYGSTSTTSFALDTPVSITNPGNYFATWKNFSITFTGPIVNPVLTNATPAVDIWVKYVGTLAAGQSVVLNVADFTAVKTGSVNVVNNIVNYGFPRWFKLEKGANICTLTADSGSGSASLSYKPPYV